MSQAMNETEKLIEKFAKFAMSIPGGVIQPMLDDDPEDLDRMQRAFARFAAAHRELVLAEAFKEPVAWGILNQHDDSIWEAVLSDEGDAQFRTNELSEYTKCPMTHIKLYRDPRGKQ